MDETPVYFDMSSRHTFDLRGISTVNAKTTGKHAIAIASILTSASSPLLIGHEKLRFTVVLTMTADGGKRPSMIIFKNLKKVPDQAFPAGVVITVAKGGSMTSDLMNEYGKKVWGTRGESCCSD